MQKSKKNIRITLIIAIVIALASFFIFKDTPNPVLEAKKSESYDAECHKVLSAYLKQMSKTANLHANGSGGRFGEKISLVAFSFTSHAKCDVEASKELLLLSVNSLLEKINASEKLRPFLCQYPFSKENVQISISFYDKKNNYYPEEFISLVMNTKNKIFYDTFDHEIYNYKTLKQEPF